MSVTSWLISVVIPAYNEQKYIRDCLSSLLENRGIDFEIIVIDDGSTDQTPQIIQQEFPQVKFLQQNHQGPGAARNLGAKEARGQILVFVDADMTFDKSFLEKLTEPIRKGEVIGTFSKEEYVANPQNFWSRWWNINASLPPHRRLPEDYPDKQEVFRAILKAEFDKVGGFTQGLGWDDDHTLYHKLGSKASLAPGAIYYHKNPSTLREVFNQARFMGKSGLTKQNPISFIRYFPLNPFRKGWKEVIFKGQWFLPIYRMIYGTAICAGIIDVWMGRSKAQ